jgi:DNA-binding winged helix-turn-helix (wHTH) protein
MDGRPVRVRFGNCRLDVDARRLYRGSSEVHLSPKAFEFLKLLVESRPRALSKDDLLERVWPGVFVSDASLARVVTQIRAGLGDAARRPTIVRTVHGFGYAFVAEVIEDPAPPNGVDEPARAPCWLVCGSREFPLTDGEHIVGREPDAHVCLESPKVSRRHARFTVRGLSVTIEDLASKNGTSVRGARISAPLGLEPGDEIEIGPFTLVFRVGVEPGSTETAITSRVRGT